jgi:signal peptidase I
MTDQDVKPSSPTITGDGWGFDSTHRADPTNETTAGNPGESEATTEGKKRPSAIREIIETIVLAALIFVLVRSVVLNYRVDGHSMDPSLADNEMLFVNRNAYLEFDRYALVDWLPFVDHKEEDTVQPFGGPERGDIIVLTPPVDGATKPYIKRVIGLPGETVEIHDNKVFVNGIELDEPYIGGEQTYCGQPGGACPEYTVPEGYVFVLGDNRNASEDSRMIGMIPEENIIGKAWFTYWPTDYFGPVPHEDYPELAG